MSCISLWTWYLSILLAPVLPPSLLYSLHKNFSNSLIFTPLHEIRRHLFLFWKKKKKAIGWRLGSLKKKIETIFYVLYHALLASSNRLALCSSTNHILDQHARWQAASPENMESRLFRQRLAGARNPWQLYPPTHPHQTRMVRLLFFGIFWNRGGEG